MICDSCGGVDVYPHARCTCHESSPEVSPICVGNVPDTDMRSTKDHTAVSAVWERAQEIQNELVLGSLWHHKKGGQYRILAVALEESTSVPLVVYASVTYGTVWVRPLSEWASRFRRV